MFGNSLEEKGPKKLNYQLQEMAFQKYPFQINDKTFFCLETFYEGQLLNGIDLELKEVKGITSDPQKIAYISHTLELIMAVGSNIIAFNTQKRTYTLLTQVKGYVQILRTYSCKLNNKTFIYWLESDEQGLNQKNAQYEPNKQSQKNKQTQKITSIWNLYDGMVNQKGKTNNQIIDQKGEDIKENSQSQGKSSYNNKAKNNVDLIKQQKTHKKVRIQEPEQKEQKKKKKMRICIFDFQKKVFFHLEPIEIEEYQKVEDILLYYTAQKMLSYVINDEKEEKAKVYFRKIKIEEPQTLPLGTTKKLIANRKKKKPKKAQKFKSFQAIFQINNIKYNGETDQYLFKDMNTIYSIQLQQLYNQGSSRSLSKKLVSGKSLKKFPRQNISTYSIDLSEDDENVKVQRLSKQIDKVTNSILESSKKQTSHVREKYRLKICQQIELFEDDQIVDFAISETYLVLLTQQFLRFYSIFNLNTLLFKHSLAELPQIPPASTVQLNKSYVLLTHGDSTFISTYTIMERNLKYNSTCEVEIQHCQSVLKLYMNYYNCEVAILAKQYEIEGRMTNIIKSKKVIQNSMPSYKKSYIDFSLAYINFSSSKCQSKPLFLKFQRFRNILTCKWHSEYLIQTENQIIAKEWRESFENLKCSSLHPTGQYIILGFNDCFKIYSVTQEGLQNTYMSDGVKDCMAISYSQYGQQFALGSANTIVIYNSYNCFKVHTIHLPFGSLVEYLQYRGNFLICLLKSKKVNVYNVLLKFKEIYSFNPKNYLNQNRHQLTQKTGDSVQNILSLTIKGLASIEIGSLFFDLDLKVVIFSSGQKVFFYNILTNESLGSYEFGNVTCMQYCKHLATLFLGTAKGQLVAFPWPNKPSNVMGELPRFKLHSQKIIKIKLTADFKQLITLGNDMAMYKSDVHYILNLKRLKGTQIAEHKGNKNAISYCNFLYNKGFCQFSHGQNIQKLQNQKQLQDEVVNMNFMLPEERMKQKQNLFEQLTFNQQMLKQNNQGAFKPLQQQSSNLRNQIVKVKEEYIRTKHQSQQSLEEERQKYSRENSELLKQYSQLNYQHRMLNLNLNEQTQKLKYQFKKQIQRQSKENESKLEQFLKKLQQAKEQKIFAQKRFIQIDLLASQKQQFIRQTIRQYELQQEAVNTKNGRLSCQNTALQKQILKLKYRIEELKFVTLNAHSSIQQLREKRSIETEQKTVFQKLLAQNSKIDVAEMQKKHIKATKQLIEKNKEIDIKLHQYQKEKEMLVQLEKTVERIEGEIDRIVQSFEEEKQFMKKVQEKIKVNKERIQIFSRQQNELRNIVSLKRREWTKLLDSINKCLYSYEQFKNENTKYVRKFDLKIKLKAIIKQDSEEKQQKKLKSEASMIQNTYNSKLSQPFRRSKTKNAQIQQKPKTVLSYLIPNLRKNNSSKKQRRNSSLAQRKIQPFNGERVSQKVKKNIPNTSRSLNVLKVNHNNFKNQLTKVVENQMSLKSTQRAHPIFKKSSYVSQRTKKQPQKDNIQKSILNNDEKTPKMLRINSSQSLFRRKDEELEKKKQHIIKQLSSEGKRINNINNERKLYIEAKKRLYNQNQDLITTFNSLTYDNKYYRNLFKAFEEHLDEQEKQEILGRARDDMKQTLMTTKMVRSSRNMMGRTFTQKSPQVKKTPFQSYQISKQNKRKFLKNKERENQIQEKVLTGQVKKVAAKEPHNVKRLKTLPCFQFTL